MFKLAHDFWLAPNNRLGRSRDSGRDLQVPASNFLVGDQPSNSLEDLRPNESLSRRFVAGN
jgi:hypothetical protein